MGNEVLLVKVRVTLALQDCWLDGAFAHDLGKKGADGSKNYLYNDVGGNALVGLGTRRGPPYQIDLLAIEVGQSDVPHQALFHAFLQRAPSLQEVRVVVNDAPVGVFGEGVVPGTKAKRPVDEVEVEIFQLQVC